MLAAVVMPAANASAALHFTETDNGIHGIDQDPEVGLHNSYAWCSAVFRQTETGADGEIQKDYLWVGTNRDAGGSILTLSGLIGDVSDAIYDILGMPEVSDDKAGRIYRYDLNDPEAEWELMYKNDSYSGFRKMIVFDGDLYVFAGITNRLPAATGSQFAAVYRFSADFAYGDTPEVVHWVRFPAITATDLLIECYRSAFVYDGYMYIGIFNGEIYRTAEPIVQSTVPNNGLPANRVYADGWELVANLDQGTSNSGPKIWDITMFNGSLYAFVTGAGFAVYKLTDTGVPGELWTMEQIVGDEDEALYPAGLGVTGHVAASPFLSTAFDQDYVYVTTFANGPAFMTLAGAGQLVRAFENHYNPANIYRFNANDEWEVIVGEWGVPKDDETNKIAIDKNGNPVPVIGNMRSGFYLGESEQNPSPNLYIWQMVEHEGRLYATTWDVGVFRKAIPFMITNVFIQNFGTDNMEELAGLITDVAEDLAAIAVSLADPVFFENVVQNLSSLGESITDYFGSEILTEGFLQSLLEDFYNQLVIDLLDVVDITLLQNLRTSMDALTDALGSEDMLNAITETMDVLAAVAFFIMDRSNPAGFDIFYSDDGVNFYPYTVNGFGHDNNYGGRNLLSTEYGLFVLTANPFTGCQVWLLDDVKPSISSAHTDSISMKVGGTVTFFVETEALAARYIGVTLGDGKAVNAKIEFVGEVGQIATSYWSSIDTATNILGQVVYVEDGRNYAPVHRYEVTLTGLSAFEGTVDMIVDVDGMQSTYTVDLLVEDEDTNWILIAAVAAAAVIAVIVGAFVIRRPKA